MNGAAIRSGGRGGAIVGVLLALALFVRLIVPSGWMPIAGNGYAITLCTGAGMVSAWVDGNGVVHKDGKGPAQKAEHPCIFAGFGTDLLPGGVSFAVDSFVALTSQVIIPPLQAVSIGRGLAAPPPPPTGPPASL